jgi:hypothetical protein
VEFKKYQHVERFGNDEVDGIELGDSYIFPKIDGTNGQTYLNNNDEVESGSRNRVLTIDKDNAGFCEFISNNENIKQYLQKHPTHRLYGEWLIPHSLKTYQENAWRKFYIFDITVDKDDEEIEYIPYDIYKPLLDEFNLDYIPPIAKVKNVDYDTLIKLLNDNHFLIKDGEGSGEGIVIKNYDFYNRFKRQTWAKIVTNEFKEKHNRTMGYNELKAKEMIEQQIVDDFCTAAFIEKEYAKIVEEKDGWTSRYIPMLLSKVFYELINEETWHFIKKYKNPKVDFKTLNVLVTQKIKSVKSEIFG